MGAPAELLRAWEAFAKGLDLEYRCADDSPSIRGRHRGVPVSIAWNVEIHVDGGSAVQGTVLTATSKPHSQINLTVERSSRPRRTQYWHRRTGDEAFDAAFSITCYATGFAERVLTERVRAWLTALGDARVGGMSREVTVSVPGDETDPDRLRALLELVTEVAIVGSAVYLGE